CLAIRAGAQFIGTNPDKTFPAEEGIVPGCGSLLAALEAATDVQPIVIGKPERAMFDTALHLLQAQAATTLMVGDRIDTDIDGARRAGLHTAMVLTGVSSAEEAANHNPPPDGVFADLPALHEAWQRQQAATQAEQ
ncbi:MAG: HAD-IA family hydrolase, partial [Herpetosiphonaceae bacterium]|nr:HAD-IA family hydrolase [Herpetosiphonaceae bacterium]